MSEALRFNRFSFSYPSQQTAVGPVSWTVDEGSFTLLVGATGSGKTTLLRCAKPEIAPAGNRDGEITVFGEQLNPGDSNVVSRLVGYVAQNPDNQLVCDTVWHEMAFGLENQGVPQDQMRRRVAEVAHFFGIEPWFHRSVNQLSGGQRQLLNLASILVLQPKVLLLDEPTAQLDPVAQRSFCHALFRLNRELGLTVVVATHAPQTMAAYATHCVMLEDGVICEKDVNDYRERPLQVADCSAADEAGDAVITLSDAYVRYSRADEFVLSGADLRIMQGDIHALVGGNGCGKSTLLKTVAGVLKPTRGKVMNGLSRSQALLPQDPKALFVCDSVYGELMEWGSACGYGSDDVASWLDRIGLASQASNHPYDLSGGQQQLLAFAKLALTQPGLLLLDEPAKGLDCAAKQTLAMQLEHLNSQGCTVVMATHDLAFAACVARRISMVFDGQVTSTERCADFFQQNLFYRPMADSFTDAWIARGEGCA